ncbi:hypothetical protein V8E55_007298 [Tylopilus felleus]
MSCVQDGDQAQTTHDAGQAGVSEYIDIEEGGKDGSGSEGSLKGSPGPSKVALAGGQLEEGMDSAGGDMGANLNPAPPGGVLAAPGYEQSSYLGRGQDSTGHPTTATQRSEPRKEDAVANIVIFGETGVGKSSVINLIADEKVAHTSNDSQGCTFHHNMYYIPLGDTLYNFWDTAGLDEGSEGTVPAEEAENRLRELMRSLAHLGGINLIIYCVRGTRLTKALRRNYDLFYVKLCQEKVPVALVVTGLEHQQGEMETWWLENEAALRRHGMRFDAHACVTTVNAQDPFIQQRRSESRAQLCKLVRKHSTFPGWKADSSLISWVLSKLQTFLRATPPTRHPGNTATVRKVAVCGSLPPCLPGSAAVMVTGTHCIGNTQYQFIRVDKQALYTFTSRISEEIRGMDLLVFYASAVVDDHIQSTDVETLTIFYKVTGEERPMIVVLQDCDVQKVASTCRDQIAPHRSPREIQVHFISISSTNGGGATMLDDKIEKLCMEQDEGRRKVSSRYR